MNLSRSCFSQQTLPQLLPWHSEALVGLRPPFDYPRLDALGTFGIDFQFPQFGSQRRFAQSAERVRKTDPLRRDFLTLRRGAHHGANQVVNQREDRELLQHAVDGLTV